MFFFSNISPSYLAPGGVTAHGALWHLLHELPGLPGAVATWGNSHYWKYRCHYSSSLSLTGSLRTCAPTSSISDKIFCQIFNLVNGSIFYTCNLWEIRETDLSCAPRLRELIESLQWAQHSNTARTRAQIIEEKLCKYLKYNWVICLNVSLMFETHWRRAL